MRHKPNSVFRLAIIRIRRSDSWRVAEYVCCFCGLPRTEQRPPGLPDFPDTRRFYCNHGQKESL